MKIITMRGRFRWKAILIVVLSCALLGAGWHLLHEYQMTAMQPRLLEQATRAENSTPPQPELAKQLLQRYVMVQSDDADTRARLGVLWEKRAKGRNEKVAILRDLYEKVLEQEPDRQDIRKRAATLAYELGLFDDALKHLAFLSDTSDAEVDLLQGKCKVAKVKVGSVRVEAEKLKLLKDAAEHYRGAVKKLPQQLAGYELLAYLLRDSKELATDEKQLKKNQEDAKESLDQMIAHNPTVVEAYLKRARFYMTNSDLKRANHDLERASQDLEKARQLVDAKLAEAARAQPAADDEKLAAEHATVLLASALVERRLAEKSPKFDPKSPHIEQSRAYLQKARKLYPKDTRILPETFRLELMAGRRAEAIDTLKRAQKEAKGPERNSLLWELATLLIEELNSDPKHMTANRAEAKEVIQEMRKGRVPAHRLELLEAMIAIRDNQWHDAAVMLEHARPLLAEDVNRAAQLEFQDPRLKADLYRAELMLGFCYGQLNNWEQQLTVYKLVVKSAPEDPGPRRSLVNALSSQGRLEDALEECRILKALPRASVDDEILYARLWISKSLRLRQTADPRWDEMGKYLNDLRATLAKNTGDAKSWSIAIEMLRAEVKMFQYESQRTKGLVKEAEATLKETRQILTEAKKAAPDDIDMWIAVAVLAARTDGAAAALKLLDEAQTEFGDAAELRLARIRFAPGGDKAPALAYLQPLTQKLDKFNHVQQALLLWALALAYESAGAEATAEKLWQGLVDLEPKQLRTAFALFDFYQRARNRDGMAKALRMIHVIEGADEGPGGKTPKGKFGLYGEAQILLLDALEKKDKLSTDELKQRTDAAQKYLLAAEAKDRNWNRISESLALVAALQPDGKKKETDYLRRAVELGSRQLSIVEALINRYMESGRMVEAEDLLFKLQQSEPIGSDLLKIAAGLSTANKNTVRALDLVRSAASAKSKQDHKDYLWYGQMLGRLAAQSQGDQKSRLFKEAESALQTAIELATDVPEPWVAMARLQASAGAVEKAKARMESMKEKIPPAQLPLALAQCYVAINDKVNAEKVFADGVAAEPKDGGDEARQRYLALVHSAAKFQFENNRPDKAEAYLRVLLEPKQKSPGWLLTWARRHLAVSLWYQGNQKRFPEARKLVEENLREVSDSPDDQIVWAFLLTAEKDSRPKAIGMLEKAFAAKEPTGDQLLFLSNLYDAQGDWRKAHASMQELVGKHGADPKYPEYLGIYIGKLVDHNDLGEAQEWMGVLQKIQPHLFGTVDRLVRLHAKRNEPDEIARPIKKYLESKEAKPADPGDRLTMVALLLGDLARRHPSQMAKIRADNEKLLKSAAAKTSKKESMLAVADFLGVCQRLDESLELCEKAFKELPATMVLPVAVSAISANVAKPGQVQRVEAMVKEAMAKSAQKKTPDGVVWDAYLAVLKEREGQYDDAEKLYRKVIARLPENVVALNNLAFLLALRGPAHEALTIIDKLIAMSGAQAEIMDTRGVILRALGRLPEAEQDIQTALRQEKTAYRLFHLALVHDAAVKPREAMQAFDEAMKLGLKTHNGMLHPLERGAYQHLLDEHERNAKAR